MRTGRNVSELIDGAVANKETWPLGCPPDHRRNSTSNLARLRGRILGVPRESQYLTYRPADSGNVSSRRVSHHKALERVGNPADYYTPSRKYA